MNRHILFDKTMLLAFRLMGAPFFENSLDTPPLKEHVDAVTFCSDLFSAKGTTEFRASSLAGYVNTCINVVHNAGKGAPVILYNMGGGEAPFDSTIKRAYPGNEASQASVVAIEAPYQRTRKQLGEAFGDLNTYMAMMAIAVRMNEQVLRSEYFRDSPLKIVAGTSLGGFIANRHHLQFNTANAYVPFVAGTRHGEIFLTTIRSSKLVENNPDYLRSHLNFDKEWLATTHPNVFPQLGRFDQLNRLSVQGPSYGAMELDIWNGGHLFHVFHPELLRAKLDRVMNSQLSC